MIPTTPGIYPGISKADYLAIRAYGSSFLSDCEDKCLAFARWRMTAEEEVSDRWTTMQRGDCLHARLLEPARFDAEFLLGGGQCEAKTKAGERCSKGGTSHVAGSWWCSTKGHAPEGDADPRTVVTAAQLAEVDAMAAAVRAEAGDILERATHLELAALAEDEQTGLPICGRFDVVDEREGTIYDLKSVADACPERWGSVMAREGHHIQAAHYLAVARACGLDVERFGWIAVENSKPHLVAVYPHLDEEHLEIARGLRRGWLAKIAQCEAEGRWPGYGRWTAYLPEFYARRFTTTAALGG